MHTTKGGELQESNKRLTSRTPTSKINTHNGMSEQLPHKREIQLGKYENKFIPTMSRSCYHKQCNAVCWLKWTKRSCFYTLHFNEGEGYNSSCKHCSACIRLQMKTHLKRNAQFSPTHQPAVLAPRSEASGRPFSHYLLSHLLVL